MRIDLNGDVGEGAGDDEGLMRAITSASIAAGLHAGDPSLIRRTLRLAKTAGVAVGVHPSFPDREHFGRREMQLSREAVEALVLYQIAAVAGMAAAEGLTLQHVKPHGALYNMSARDADLASAVARATATVDAALILVGPPNSVLLRYGQAAGLKVAAEVFADRAYEPDGSLMARSKPGAVIHDPEIVATRAVHLARHGGADTICIHGDTPGAAARAALVRQRLEHDGVLVRSMGHP